MAFYMGREESLCPNPRKIQSRIALGSGCLQSEPHRTYQALADKQDSSQEIERAQVSTVPNQTLDQPTPTEFLKAGERIPLPMYADSTTLLWRLIDTAQQQAGQPTHLLLPKSHNGFNNIDD